MLSTREYRNSSIPSCLQFFATSPQVLWQSFLLVLLLSSFIPVSHTIANIDQLQGEAGFRMASLHWKYLNPEKTNPSFRIRYCEVQSWGLHRCRYQVVESNSSRNGRQDKMGSMADVFVEIGGLRMATNYSFQVLPQEAGVKGGRPSQISLQTKGFSAKATKCLADSSEVSIETGPFFGGRISVDESEVPGCFISGDPTSPQTQYIMTIKHHACGSQVNGSKVSTIILVQENLPILTHSTRKFVVLCSFSPESFVVKTGVTLPRDTSVAKAIDFSGIIRLSPQGTNLLIADKDQLPNRRGSVRDSHLTVPVPQFTPVVDQSEFLANENTLQELSSEPSSQAISQTQLPPQTQTQLDLRGRQSRAYFQTHELPPAVPSAAAAVQRERASSGNPSGSGLKQSGWEGFLVLGLVSMGIIASVSSLIWFVKSYRTGPPAPSEDGFSEASSVTDDEGPYSISSVDDTKGLSPLESCSGTSRAPHNLDTRSELEVELDFEFSEERNTSLIYRNYGSNLSNLQEKQINGPKSNPPLSIA